MRSKKEVEAMLRIYESDYEQNENNYYVKKSIDFEDYLTNRTRTKTAIATLQFVLGIR